MTIAEMIEDCRAAFKSAGIPEPLISAQFLVSEALGIGRMDVHLQADRKLGAREIRRIRLWAGRRLRHEPLQYIIGKAYFRHLELSVGPGVLVPRAETELLAEWIIENARRNAAVCEIGTGSGAVAVSVAEERPDLKVYATEISGDALKYARRNRRDAGVPNLRIYQGDLLSPFKRMRFDVIAANLPYIKTSDIERLPCEIREFEPYGALDGGRDGLETIKRLFGQAPPYLEKGGTVIAEISPDQKNGIRRWLEKRETYRTICFVEDFSCRARFAAAVISG